MSVYRYMKVVIDRYRPIYRPMCVYIIAQRLPKPTNKIRPEIGLEEIDPIPRTVGRDLFLNRVR